VEEQSALSKFPLLWMLDQASARGLRIRTAMVNHLVRGLPRKGARQYQKPNPGGQLHVSLKWYWRLVEWWPKNAKLREWPARKAVLGRYIPWGEPRFIAVDDWVHASVYERMAYVSAYRPVNVPPPNNVEPLSLPPQRPRKRRP
jgi:hypothetical protein